MKTLLICSFWIVSSIQAVSFLDVVLQEWNTWKLKHGRTYSSRAEEKLRMKVYMENKLKLEEHNGQAHQGNHEYHLEMNKFGDLLPHEFSKKVNGFKMVPRNKTTWLRGTFLQSANVGNIPSHVDWRTKGAVTPVKDQGRCGSCYSFATTGALEGMNFRKTGKLVSLSEQQIVDCSGKYGNEGCNGGMMDASFEYIKDNRGIDTEQSYPYEGYEDYCNYNPNWKGASDVGFVDIESGNENMLMHAVARRGPIAVAIDASHMSMQFYHSGVYRERRCSQYNLDHAVLVVGYGEDKKRGRRNGGKYWLVKNSWGAGWGNAGYIKMARGDGNMCGIATMASYPLV